MFSKTAVLQGVAYPRGKSKPWAAIFVSMHLEALPMEQSYLHMNIFSFTYQEASFWCITCTEISK